MDNSMPTSNSNYNGNCIDNNDLINQINGNQNIPSPYTFPAILHYLQYEWQKLEQEKQQWLIEKAELQAQLTILEGRVMSQFNLKKDLIRRIKMLEYCLRAERAKYHKLKYGVEPPPLHVEDDEFKNENLNDNPEITTNTNWKKGRHLLRQYLMEIGYTDAIINIRSNRVRHLLGLNINEDELNDNNNQNNLDNKDDLNKKPSSKKFIQQQNPAKFLASEAEHSVDATIAFLKEQQAMQNDDQDDLIDSDDVIDSETEEVLNEFNFLSAHQSNTTVVNTVQSNQNKNLDIGELANITPNDEKLDNQQNIISQATLGDKMKELSKNLLLNFKESHEWNPRFVLKSHFDCVRCIKFHFKESLIVTGSDDDCIKLWNLNKSPLTSNKNKASTQDLEPIYTYRGHKSHVLSLLIVDNQIISGGKNGEILVWKIPDNFNSIDPYDTFDPNLFLSNLNGHTDAVWSLVEVPTNNEQLNSASVGEVDTTKLVDTTSDDQSEQQSKIICSASADCTIKVWDLEKRTCIKTIVLDKSLGRPTCLIALPLNATLDSTSNVDTSKDKQLNNSSLSQYIACSFTNGSIQIYDLNSPTYSQSVLKFGSVNSVDQSRINSIIVHPTLTVIVSAHEDRNLRFWDYTTGKCIHEMIAHLGEVSCLDIDLEGLYLLSGSHDSSIRLWNFESRRCIKETKTHIEKNNESIFDVCFHPTQKYFATSGADARAKVFACGLKMNSNAIDETIYS